MAEKSPVLGKKWAFCKGFAGCFPRILLTGRGVSCKKTLGIEKSIKKLWDSTVHIFRIYAFAESAYLGGFESLSRGFEGVFALKSISKTRKTLKKLSAAEIAVNSVSLPRIPINSMSEKTGAVKSGRQRIAVGRYRLIVTGDDGKYRNQPSLLSQPSLPTQTGKTKKPEERLLSHW